MDDVKAIGGLAHAFRERADHCDKLAAAAATRKIRSRHEREARRFSALADHWEAHSVGWCPNGSSPNGKSDPTPPPRAEGTARAIA